MPNKWDDETKEKIAAGAKKSWESGERKAPITKLKEEKASLQEELADVKARLARLEEKFARLEGVIQKHRGTIDEGQKRLKPGNDFRSFLDDLTEAWEKPSA